MRLSGILMMMAAMLVCGPVMAQAPAGATGQCKDNSYTTAAKKWQACSGHKGVQTWYADAKPGAAAASAPAGPASAAATAASGPAAAAAPSSPKATAGKAAAASSKTAAPGGGPGLVWVNTATNVYHCPGATFYGKTKDGKYMPEADAKKAGARPDRNKGCAP